MEHWPRKGERGQSEVLGTVLVFSLVILLGVTLVGVGVVLFEDAGQEFDDRQGQDALKEIDNRLVGAETGALLEVPAAARDDIAFEPDEGSVTVTVETLPRAVNLTDGGWRNVTAEDIGAESMTNETTLELGTLTHRAEGGPATVYQGGLLFEREGGETRVLSEPGFDFRSLDGVDLASIDLSFTSLSGLDPALGSETLVQRNRVGSQQQSESIEEVVRAQRTLTGVRDFVPTVSVDITVTVETAYPAVWAEYATERMTEPLDESRVTVADDSVEIGFPTFEGEASTVPAFPERVLYAGVAGVAPLYHSETAHGDLSATEDGFAVEGVGSMDDGTSEYGLGVVEDGRWLVFDESVDWGESLDADDEVWTTLDGTATAEAATPALDIESTALGGNDTWGFDDGATVCLVTDEAGVTVDDTREAIADGACTRAVVGDPDPPRQEPNLVVDDLDVPDDPVPFGDRVQLNATLNNTGTGYANETLVGAAADLGGEELDIVAFDSVSRYPFEDPVTVTLEYVPQRNVDDTTPVEVFTPHDSVSTNVSIVDPPFFEIDDLTGLDDGALPGQSFGVNATVTNTGANATQTVSLLEGGEVVDTAQVDLGTNETETVTLTWNVPLDADIEGGTQLTVDTSDEEATLGVDRLPEALVTDVGVATTDPGDETVPVEVELRNPSTTRGLDAPVSVNTSASALLDDEPVTETVELGPDETTTVSFDVAQRDNPITDWVPVETGDDSGEDVGIVERDGPACGAVEWAGDGSESDPYEVSTVDELQCIQHEGLYDEDNHYQVVDDIAAHGTENWEQTVEKATDFEYSFFVNGEYETEETTIDGFAPIGPFGFAYPYDTYSFAEPSGADPFRGVFDGGNHEIVGLSIDAPENRFVGLFGATGAVGDDGESGDGSTVKNVVLTDAYVAGNQHVGGLVGQAGGTVEESRVEGEVVGEHSIVGGVVGDGAWASLDNRMVADVEVTGGPMDPAAGFDGSAESGDLNAEGIGGVIGRMSGDTEFATGYAVADVEGPRHVGALAGTSSYIVSNLEQSYTVGSVTATEDTDPDGNGIDEEGATVGTILDLDDSFEDSVFYDQSAFDTDWWGEVGNSRSAGPSTDDTIDDVNGATDVQGLPTGAMQGPSVLPDPDDGHDFGQYEGVDDAADFFAQYPGVGPDDAEGQMAELDWDIWDPVYETELDAVNGTVEVVDEAYPVFEWEADGFFTVEITDISTETLEPGSLTGERTLSVTATVENTGDSTRTQTVTMQNPRTDVASVVDSEQLTLAAGEATTETFTWQTGFADRLNETQNGTVIVSSDDDADTRDIDLRSFVATKLNVSELQVPDAVEALTEQLALSGGQEGASFTLGYDGSDLTAVDPRQIAGERIGLVADGTIVDAVDIDEDLAETLTSEADATVDLSWTPTGADIGTAELEVQVLGSQQRATAELEVVTPAATFVTGETLPVDADVDIITGG